MVVKLTKQSGIISMLRHYVPRSTLIRYYEANVRPLIQYGVLIYGCTSFSSLCDIEKLQRKIFRLNFFKRFKDSISPILLKHGVLTVHELYVYELLKFVLRSVLSLHSESYFNNIFTFKNQDAYLTRSSTGVMAMPAAKKKFQRVSLKYRGAKLFNILRQNNVPQLCMMNKDIFNNLVHRIKDNYILGNTELTKFIFQL